MVLPTPLVRARSLDAYLKIETGLPTGSFKVRGALHSLTANLSRRPISEVIAASTGNHGAAVAWAARQLGVAATIFLPTHPNRVKADRIRALGARIVESGVDLSAAIDAAYAYAERTGAFFLHDASDPDVPAGTAQIGSEVVTQLPAVERICVPMGDTALIRGVATAAKRAKPSIHIVGVVAANAPAYLLSWEQDDVVETSTAETIADGLAVRRPLPPNVSAIRTLVDEVVAVSEAQMLDAIRHLRAHEGITAEPAGAAATAAFLQTSVSEGSQAPTVLLVTGCNIAPEIESAL